MIVSRVKFAFYLEMLVVFINNNYSILLVLTAAQCATLDFRGLRLDWVRLQSYMCMERSQKPLKDRQALAALLDNVAFHSKMIDALDETLTETSDLSSYA